MADSRNNLPTVVEVRCQLDVHRVDSEVNNRAMSPDVENSIIVGGFNVRKSLAVLQLGLDNVVLEKALALLILERFDATLVDGRGWSLGCGEGDVSVRREDVVRVGSLGQIPALRCH